MTESPTERMVQLAVALAEKTRRGEVQWQATDDVTSFVAPLQSGTVLIRSRDGDGVEPFVLSVLNRDGVSIESLVSWDLTPNTPERREMSDLYRGARRSSLAVDQTLDGLLRELSE